MYINIKNNDPDEMRASERQLNAYSCFLLRKNPKVRAGNLGGENHIL
jgi:hypothetical protein